ncbi:choice-of-anchor I domain-containing protein [Seonamhaeicola marinus]|uniref:T9SS type A sorting domain-containing protein n=1 Tax=Seonamhaeicola marinus TaxID=1912246 RepID=A0A5D0HWM8_9FLAO|nr:esterase-like activity of phytase family protein [Seonamhaeicola marinus]TYA74537.1 T9SS type A sorting domain-containing protein [Seonamhaeicola marinus]
MKKITLIASLLALAVTFTAKSQTPLKHLASYYTNEEGSAETVAHDVANQQAFFTNSATNSFTIVDISTPANPTLVKNVDLSAYGAGPNSIAIAGNVAAVAVEADSKQDPGKVVFFDLDGNFLKEVTAGALPDMITFTPDGKKLLVANEGEPSDDYTNDPEGSITVVDLTSGVMNASVSHITLGSYNDKRASLENKGIRIFGNNGASCVAQDLEPEFITVVEDGTKAYVNCQENNAFIVLDLTNNSILDILPLGYKNHLLGTPTVESFIVNDLVASWPELGTPVYDGGQAPVMLGGFSGLYYDAPSCTDETAVFYAVPDRGPNDGPVGKSSVTPSTSQNLRPFKLPNYQGRIAKFTINRTTGAVTLDDQILLTRKDGVTPITGKGNIPGFDEVPVTYTDASTTYGNTDYVGADSEEFHALPYDEFGGDFEGVLIDKNRNFWMCDEYRPAIYNFDSNGKLIERYVPQGTSMLGTVPQPKGTYGAETLPAVYSKRRANRGFEAIAYDETKDVIYAFIQSPLYNPSSVTKNNSDVIRILGISCANGAPVEEYVYLLERNKDAGYSSSRVDKIGDAVYTGDGKFLVIERDSEGPTVETGKKYVFEIDINYATNILDTNCGLPIGKELEEMTADEIASAGVHVVHKTKVVNLPSVGYQGSDKSEGIALLPNNEIAVINDNDFGLAGAGITDNSVLGIISFANDYGFDASNKDDKINIAQHPTLGMFMPDAIASYSLNGVDYIVTANEGDARDYNGYSEEERVKDLTLNESYYPNADALQENEDLGRLKTTTATGDYNKDGVIEQIYSYGARSFSIFDEYGNLVFDSADSFGQNIKSEEPELFNEDDGDFDDRSDDKGGEPEAVAIGTIDGITYAFVGLERQSAILVYDITDPKNAEFVTYYKDNRTSGDISPEIIKFIPATDSPNAKNLLLVGYEVSGSLGVIQLDAEMLYAMATRRSQGSLSLDNVSKNSFKMYPNPVVDTNLKFSKVLSGAIYNINGQEVMKFENKSVLDVSELTSGIYIVKAKDEQNVEGAKRFVKF